MSNFYEKKYNEYFQSTIKINPTSFLSFLTQYLCKGASILDIGCGSGRDLLWLRQREFSPTGFEQSINLARLAKQYSGCPVIEGDFQTFYFNDFSFDAIISVGSLLHLPKNNLAPVIKIISQALNKNGYILFTFKEGQGSLQAADGRTFTLWSQDQLEKIFISCDLKLVNFRRSVSKIQSDVIWLEFIVKNN